MCVTAETPTRSDCLPPPLPVLTLPSRFADNALAELQEVSREADTEIQARIQQLEAVPFKAVYSLHTVGGGLRDGGRGWWLRLSVTRVCR